MKPDDIEMIYKMTFGKSGANLERVGELIRCKDCKHWKHSTIRPNYCDVWDWCNRADDFCSFAERKTE